VPGDKRQLDEVEERGQIGEPPEGAYGTGQVNTKHVVRRVRDEMVVLLRKHPFLFVVLVPHLFRHSMAGPGVEPIVKRLEHRARRGLENRTDHDIGLKLEIEIDPGLRGLRGVVHGLIRGHSRPEGRPEAGGQAYRHPIRLLEVDGGDEAVHPGLVVRLGLGRSELDPRITPLLDTGGPSLRRSHVLPSFLRHL